MADPPFLAAQKAATTVSKEGENKDQHYSYARAEDVIREAQRALHEAGLVGAVSFTDLEERPITSKSGTNGIYARVACTLKIADAEGQVVANVTGFGAGIDYPGDKAVYKAMTGASKYAYASALGIPFGDDPEDTTTSAPEAREAAGEDRLGFASEKQEKYLRRLIGTDADQNLICGYLVANFSGGRNGGISRAIDGLKEESTRADTLEKLEALAKDWDAQQQHAAPPPDDADLPQLDDITRD